MISRVVSLASFDLLPRTPYGIYPDDPLRNSQIEEITDDDEEAMTLEDITNFAAAWSASAETNEAPAVSNDDVDDDYNPRMEQID